MREPPNAPAGPSASDPGPAPDASPDAGPGPGPGTAPTWRDGDPLLDLCGEVCPFTFVRAKLLLEELPLHAVVRVVVDHPPAAVNVPRSATAWGQHVLAVTEQPARRWHIDLQKLRG